jgi:hypothetical protein
MARTATKAAPRVQKKTAAATGTLTSQPAAAAAEPRPAAAASAVPDLAGGMRAMLVQIEGEVRAVGKLSEQIDDLVGALNGRRDEQAARLLALDALRSSVDDAGLSSFFEKAIRPRRTRVPEVIPDRLSQ